MARLKALEHSKTIPYAETRSVIRGLRASYTIGDFVFVFLPLHLFFCDFIFQRNAAYQSLWQPTQHSKELNKDATRESLVGVLESQNM